MSDTERPPDPPTRPPLAGWVKVTNAAVADPKLTDRALRLWLALDKWATRPGWPSNAQLARECGWLIPKTGQPSTQKVKDAFDELETLGLVKRHTAAGSRHRTSIELTRPGPQEGAGCYSIQPGSYSIQPGSPETQGAGSYSIQAGSSETQCWVQKDPGAGSYKTQQRKEEKEIQAAAAPARPREESLEPFEPGPAEAAVPEPQGPPSRRQEAQQRIDCYPGDVEPEEPVLDEIQAFLDRWFPMRDDFAQQVRLRKRQHPTRDILKALRRVVAKGLHERCGWGLIQRILDDWLRAGGPDRGLEDDRDADMKPLPPSQRKGGYAQPGRPAESPDEPNMPPPGGWPRKTDDQLAAMRKQFLEQQAQYDAAIERAANAYNPNWQRRIDAAIAAGKAPDPAWVEAAEREKRKLVPHA